MTECTSCVQRGVLIRKLMEQVRFAFFPEYYGEGAGEGLSSLAFALLGEEQARKFLDRLPEINAKVRGDVEAMAANAVEWDCRVRDCAADELLEGANDWQADSDDEGEESVEITREDFKRRIGAPSIHLYGDGTGDFGFGDDDMFYGHFIVVYFDENGEFTEATIEG